MFRLLALLWLACVLQCSATGAAAQSTIEHLVSRGDLSRAHATLEARCGACHASFAPAAETRNCLGCHRPIAADLSALKGFHGKAPGINGQPCRTCHVEHQGRATPIIVFDRNHFDHRLTDYALTGAHSAVKCAGCHLPAVRYRQAPQTCIGCHLADDRHKNGLGRQCQDCHAPAQWKLVKPFDHSTTSYPLLGRHTTTACLGCHGGEHWAGTATSCIACHADKDIHRGSLGPKCQTCHAPSAWTAIRFDHDLQTRFPLLGGHRTATCASCHRADRSLPRPPMACAGCHTKDDVHKGRNGSDCASCHAVTAWRVVSFDHDSRTRFALVGAHRTVRCEACHTAPVTTFKPPLLCAGCHAGGDVHRGRLGSNCATCHGSAAWTTGVHFDHALTRLPLLGRHAALPCGGCHRDKTFTAAGVECRDCHDDRHHLGRFGTPSPCSTCHRPTAWPDWRFDHGTTHFALTGRHATAACVACHRRAATSAALPSDCISCHRADDVHHGRFGPNCATCHTTKSFKAFAVPARGAGWSPRPGSRAIKMSKAGEPP